MCAAGRQLFPDDKRIQFHTSFPCLDDAFDVCYVSSVLPYVDDYRGLLLQLASAAPQFILLRELAAGDIPTFATKQMNLPDKILADTQNYAPILKYYGERFLSEFLRRASRTQNRKDNRSHERI